MEIELSEEQRLLRDTCRDFAAKELTPNAKRWDREHKYPAEAVKKAFELGLGGVAVPSEWGGAGMDNVGYALAIEEISRGCASVGVTLSVNNSLYCDPVLKFGTDEQRERWLKRSWAASASPSRRPAPTPPSRRPPRHAKVTRTSSTGPRTGLPTVRWPTRWCSSP